MAVWKSGPQASQISSACNMSIQPEVFVVPGRGGPIGDMAVFR